MRMFNVGRGLLKSGAPGAADLSAPPEPPAPAPGKGLASLSPEHRRYIVLGIGGLAVVGVVLSLNKFLLAPKPVATRLAMPIRRPAPVSKSQAPLVAQGPLATKKAEEGATTVPTPLTKAEGRPVEGAAKAPAEPPRELLARAPEIKGPAPAKAPPAAPPPPTKAEGTLPGQAAPPATLAPAPVGAPVKSAEKKGPAESPAKAPATQAPAVEPPKAASLPREAKAPPAPARPPAEAPRAPEAGKAAYALQVGAMAREENAVALKEKLAVAGYQPTIRKGAGVVRRYKVYVGSYVTKQEGEDAGRRLNVDGFPSTVVRPGDHYSLEVGSFVSEDDAIDLARELQVKNYPTKIGPQRGQSAIFHIRLGSFASVKEARKQGEELRAKGFSAVVIKQ